MKFLLSKGADVNAENKEGDTAITSLGFLSAKKNNAEMIRLLVSKGANINHKNKDGDTALHTAVLFGKSGLVKALLNNGANPRLKNDDGETPLLSVCSINDTKDAISIVDMLIAKGANINSRDGEGDTLSGENSGCEGNKELFAYLKSKGLH